MSHYGIYIWPCYLLVLVLFGYHLYHAWCESRRVLKDRTILKNEK